MRHKMRNKKLVGSTGALLVALVLILTMLALRPKAAEAAGDPVVPVNGTIGVDTTWTTGSVYHLQSDVVVAEGIALTIQPGAVIKASPQVSLFVRGTLNARGTSGSKIVFTSLQDDQYGGDTDGDGAATPPQPGNWGWVQFEDSSQDAASFIEHAVIRYGGLEQFGCCSAPRWGGIVLSNAQPTLANITFEANTVNGVGIPGGAKQATATVSGERWANTGMVYVVHDDLVLAPGFKLTIAPGMIVKLAGRTSIVVQGALDTRGTAEDPITFTSLNDDAVGGDTDNDGPTTPAAPEDWGWIEYSATSDDGASYVQHAVIRYGGLEQFGCCSAPRRGAIVLVDAQPTLSNITFEQNRFNGVGIPGGTKAATATNASERWANTGVVYIVHDDLIVADGFKLTISPGMIVKFEPRASLYVQGALEARGAEGRPITFTSINDDATGGDTDNDGAATAPQADDWGWVQFDNSSKDSESAIERAIFRYSGLEQYGCCSAPRRSAIILFNAQPTLTHITFTQNRFNAVGIAGGDQTADELWANTTVPYLVESDVVVKEGAKLTITPGMVVKFAGQVSIYVQGSLDAQGTAAAPLIFTSLNDDTVGGDSDADGSATPPQPRDWGWIEFQDSSRDAGSTLIYATIRYSGQEQYGCCSAPQRGAIVLVNAQPTLADITFVENHINGVEIPGGTKSATAGAGGETWANVDVSYIVTGNLVLAQGFKLDILPGVVVKFAGGARLTVQGALEARGLPDDPAIFTSLDDDEYGGDTDSDGAATPPQAGDWGYIDISASSDDQRTLIDNAVIRYGTAIFVNDAAPRIANSRVTLNVRGFEIRAGAAPLLSGNKIHNNKEQGVFVSNARPIIRQSSIYNNGSFGMQNETPAICVNAQSNWWGAPDGPSDTSSTGDSCELVGNSGVGQKVTNGVDYEPWLGAAPTPIGDLVIGALDVWTDPATIYAGDLAGVGVNVRSNSDHTLTSVQVGFYLGNPAAGGKPIGEGVYTLPVIGTWSVASQWTTAVWDTTGLAGTREIYVVVDPANQIVEADEGNNTVVRRVQIASGAVLGADTTPPTGRVEIQGGALSTEGRAVSLTLDAADNPSGSGVAKVYIVELALNMAVRQWLPVQQSGWLPYAASLPWTLAEGGGGRYLQAWFADGAGNISVAPATAFINLTPPEEALTANGWSLYRLPLRAGQQATVTLTPIAGDPDLYIWAPGETRRPTYLSNQDGGATDQVVFTATRDGVYQVQVYGYSAARFRLTLATQASAQTELSAQAELAQTQKSLPAQPLSLAEPAAQLGVPPVAEITSPPGRNLYLPLLRR